MRLEEKIRKLDSKGMEKRIRNLPNQLITGKEAVEKTSIPYEPSLIKAVMISGLGGSAIAGDIMKGYLRDNFSLPIEVNRSYTLPSWVGEDTLVFAVSYSGNTEETLSSYEIAKERGAKIIAVTSNGKLKNFAENDGFPCIEIPEGYPPRAAFGFLFSSLLYTFKKLGWWNRENEIEETISLLKKMGEELSPSSPENLALNLAQSIQDSISLIYASQDYFYGVAMRWKTQLNENSKAPAFYAFFPELDHNEIMGWEGVKDKIFTVILLKDEEESLRMQARINFTMEIIKEKTAKIIEVKSKGKSLLARIFSLIYIGDWVSFYLAILNEVDPTVIKSIDKLKKLMAGVR